MLTSKSPRIVEAISVVFDDQTHLNLHRVLLSFGFSCEIFPPDLRVGLKYRHVDKRLEVALSVSDGEYRATTFDMSKRRGERVHTEESYTGFEWEWMDAASSEVEYLRRELHILMYVRPKSLLHPPNVKDF